MAFLWLGDHGCISYAMVTDSHVRVDLLHVQLNRKTQRVIEILGILALMAPFLYLMVDQGYDYFAESLRVNERSDSPTGLSARWHSRQSSRFHLLCWLSQQLPASSMMSTLWQQ